MATNKIPEVINDMRVYRDGDDNAISATKMELPELKSLTTDVTGIGVAGKIEAPIEGHFDSMEATISWAVPTEANAKLFGGASVSFEAYADVQGFDGGQSEYTHDQYRVAMRGRIKSHKLGTLEAGSASNAETTIEVHYLKVEINGRELCEIDKYGYKAVLNGIDQLEQVRKNIGM